jgi:hypothetical protein
MKIQWLKSLNLLKSNGPNSISKDALRDDDCPWLINCTTQEYLVNVGQDSHFNKTKYKFSAEDTIQYNELCYVFLDISMT